MSLCVCICIFTFISQIYVVKHVSTSVRLKHRHICTDIKPKIVQLVCEEGLYIGRLLAFGCANPGIMCNWSKSRENGGKGFDPSLSLSIVH